MDISTLSQTEEVWPELAANSSSQMHMQKVSSLLSLGRLPFFPSSLSCTEIEGRQNFLFLLLIISPFYSNFIRSQTKTVGNWWSSIDREKWYGVSILHFLLFMQKSIRVEVMWCSRSHGSVKKILPSHSLIFWNISSAYFSQVLWNWK